MKSIPRTAKVGLLIFISAMLLWSGYLFILRHPPRYDVSLLVPSYEKILKQDEVRLSLPQEAFSYRSKYIETQIINDTDQLVTHGYAFKFEVQIDDKWYKVPPRENSLVPLPAISIDSGTSSTFNHWIDNYQCRPGHHRIIKEVSIEPDRDAPKTQDEANIGDAAKIEESKTTQIPEAPESIRELLSQGLTGDQAAAVQRYREEMEKMKQEPQRIKIAVEFDLI